MPAALRQPSSIMGTCELSVHCSQHHVRRSSCSCGLVGMSLQHVDATRELHSNSAGYPASADWLTSVTTEMTSMIDKDVLIMGALPSGVHALPTKFVFKHKLLNSGKVDKFKTRLVAKGFKQIFGVDHGETFAPVFQIV